jgi:hypothetical protein
MCSPAEALVELMASVVAYLLSVLMVAVLAVTVLYELCLLAEIARRLHPRRLRRWWRRPPGPPRKELQRFCLILHAAWRRTRAILHL